MPNINDYPTIDFVSSTELDSINLENNKLEILDSLSVNQLYFNAASSLLQGLIGQYETSLDFRGEFYVDGVFEYRLCNGQGLLKTNYPILFDNLNITTTSMLLPNMKRYNNMITTPWVDHVDTVINVYNPIYYSGSLGNHIHTLPDHTHVLVDHQHDIQHTHDYAIVNVNNNQTDWVPLYYGDVLHIYHYPNFDVTAEIPYTVSMSISYYGSNVDYTMIEVQTPIQNEAYFTNTLNIGRGSYISVNSHVGYLYMIVGFAYNPGYIPPADQVYLFNKNFNFWFKNTLTESTTIEGSYDLFRVSDMYLLDSFSTLAGSSFNTTTSSKQFYFSGSNNYMCVNIHGIITPNTSYTALFNFIAVDTGITLASVQLAGTSDDDGYIELFGEVNDCAIQGLCHLGYISPTVSLGDGLFSIHEDGYGLQVTVANKVLIETGA